MITNSERLLCIASLVPLNSYVYDIGSDHGYLPIILVTNKIANKVIAVENKKGPYERLSSNVKDYSQIEPYFGDGLDGFKDYITVITAAGIGGKTIVEIFKKFFDKEKKRDLTIIVEPQSDVELVRRFFNENGYKISFEKYVKEQGKYYPIISYKLDSEMMTDINYIYGTYSLKNKDKLLYEYLTNNLKKYEEINSPSLNSKINLIKEALKSWKK